MVVQVLRASQGAPPSNAPRKNGGEVMKRVLAGLSAALCVSGLSSVGFAQPFPSKPIRFVVAYPPGGAVDTISRLVGERLSVRFGQQVIVDNRGGANGAIALGIVANSPPDGHTIVAVAQAFLTHQAVSREFKYDVRKDFAPVMLGATFPMVLAVHPSVPVNSVKELIELAKSKPGKVTYGDNGGIGSSGHIGGEQFKQRTGVDITHVLYKGGGPMLVDLIGGQIQMSFAHITSVLPHIRGGRLRPLATTSTARLPALPDVPTLIELGFDGLTTSELWAVLGPDRMPPAILKKLNEEMVQIMKLPHIYDRLTGEGAQVVATSPEQFRTFINTEVPKLAAILQRAEIKQGQY